MSPPDREPDVRAPANPFALDASAATKGSGAGEQSWRLNNLPRIFLGQKLVLVVLATLLATAAAHIALTFEPREAAVLFLALVGSIAVLMNPFLGIVGYFVLAFLRPQDLFWGLQYVRLTMLASVATGAAFGIHLMLRPRLDFLQRWETLYIAVLWISLYLSTQFGRFGSEEARWIGYYSKIFVIYFLMIGLVDSTRRLQHLSWIIAGSVGYLAIWANNQYFGHGVYIVGGPGQTLKDENDFAMFLVMAVPFMWYLMQGTRNLLVRVTMLGLLPITAHAVMLTYSRGGFLGLCATMGYVALREKNRLLSTFMVVSGLVFWIAFAGQNYQQRIGSIDDYQNDGSATGRLESWDTGGRMLADNPIFGVGLKRYVEAYPHYSRSLSERPREAHNSWVQLAAESGIFAVTAYGLLILASVYSFRRIHRRIPLLPDRTREATRLLNLTYQATLVGYLVCGFFLSMEDQEFFYLIVAMVQILDRVSARQAQAALETPPADGANSVPATLPRKNHAATSHAHV